jgi:hypothetical protein
VLESQLSQEMSKLDSKLLESLSLIFARCLVIGELVGEFQSSHSPGRDSARRSTGPDSPDQR